MALTIKHLKVSTLPDGANTDLVRPTDWNADHALTGVASIAQGGTGAATQSAALNALLPTQTGQDGKSLITNAGVPAWGSTINSTSYPATGQATIIHAIPAWVKRLTLSFVGTSHAGANPAALCTLGVNGVEVTTGYNGYTLNGSWTVVNFTNYFVVSNVTAAAGTINGMFTILNLGGNLWQQSGQDFRAVDGIVQIQGCTLQAAGVVNQLIIKAGTSVFDAGTIVVTME